MIPLKSMLTLTMDDWNHKQSVTTGPENHKQQRIACELTGSSGSVPLSHVLWRLSSVSEEDRNSPSANVPSS